MAVFVYTGRTRGGQTITGEMEGANREAVVARLRSQQVIATAVRTKPKDITIPGLGGKVSDRDIVIFSRQFATMIAAGLPLVQCLEILASQQDNKALKKTLTEIRQSVEGGSTFAAALKQHPKVFSSLYANMVEAGEAGGILDTILNRLAQYMEKAMALKKKVKSASLAVTVLLSPWLAVSWERLVGARPGWEPYRNPFSRIFDRCFLFTSILLFFPCRRFLRRGSASRIGLAPRAHAPRDIAVGFFLSAASMALLLGLMAMQDIYTPFFRLEFGESMRRILSALLSGFSVALLEEIFFRGIFFKAMADEGKLLRAFLVTNVLYAAVHFVQPESDFQLLDYDPWGGLRYLAASFKPFLGLADLFPGLVGLFIIGLVLSHAVLRTRTLFFAMGLHAGWVFSIKTVRVFGDYTRDDLGWLFGSTNPKIVSGVVTWIAIMLVGAAVHGLTRRRAAQLSDCAPLAAEAPEQGCEQDDQGGKPLGHDRFIRILE